jgi:hypothetical protein
MMYGYGAGYGGFAMMHAFGGTLGILFLIGLAFFVAWAIKTLKKEQLLRWSIFLIVAAIIGGILMAGLTRFGDYKYGGKNFQKGAGVTQGCGYNR